MEGHCSCAEDTVGINVFCYLEIHQYVKPSILQLACGNHCAIPEKKSNLTHRRDWNFLGGGGWGVLEDQKILKSVWSLTGISRAVERC